MSEPVEIILANPRGFCAGVERAIEIVERAITKYGPPIYVRHEIVHNKHVVESLRAKGQSSSTRSTKSPKGPSPSSVRMALPKKSRSQPGRVNCRLLMPHAL